jgi:hypothetical protein
MDRESGGDGSSVNDAPERLLQLTYLMLPAYAANIGAPWVLALTAVGHITVHHLAYALGIRDTRW